MNQTTIDWILIGISILLVLIVSAPWIIKIFKFIFKKTSFQSLGESSKIRLVHQLNEAVKYLSFNKIGAIVTIVNKDKIDEHRTDGMIIDANISSALIIAIFSKKSPLHDGAIVIEKNKISYAGTYYKITNRSIDNKYGARHRAALGISEQIDAITIIVSEETGEISIANNGRIFKVKLIEFQKALTKHLNVK